MNTIEPNDDYMLIEPVREPKDDYEDKNGILVPTKKVAELPKTATIINVGANIKKYKQHDTIYYRLYAGSEVLLNDEVYLIISEEDVLGRVIEVKK